MLQTNDAGAFFRFTDIYSKMIGGQLELALDPPTVEPSAKEGLINVRDFSVKGEAALDRVAAGGPTGTQSGVSFSRIARRIHPAKRTAHDPRGRREGTDDRRDHRRQHRLPSPTRCA